MRIARVRSAAREEAPMLIAGVDLSAALPFFTIALALSDELVKDAGPCLGDRQDAVVNHLPSHLIDVRWFSRHDRLLSRFRQPYALRTRHVLDLFRDRYVPLIPFLPAQRVALPFCPACQIAEVTEAFRLIVKGRRLRQGRGVMLRAPALTSGHPVGWHTQFFEIVGVHAATLFDGGLYVLQKSRQHSRHRR
jgi:hypothetical protein